MKFVGEEREYGILYLELTKLKKQNATYKLKEREKGKGKEK